MSKLVDYLKLRKRVVQAGRARSGLVFVVIIGAMLAVWVLVRFGG